MNSTNLIEDLRLLSPPSYVAWWVLGAVAVLALAVWLGSSWRTRRSQDTGAGSSGSPLWDAALAALERLTPLLKGEESRAYAIQSTTILRRYIEDRYSLRAPKLATEEFLVVAGESPLLPEDHRASLRHFLELSDLLKFGRYLASGAELERLHAAAVAFVIASRPAVVSSEISEAAQ